MSLAPFLLLAGLLWAAPVQVETPSGRTAVETDDETLARRKKTCLELASEYEKQQAPAKVDPLLPCLSDPDPKVRIAILETLRYTTNPGVYPAENIPKMKQAAAITSKDPVNEVRYASGRLSVNVEGWENSFSREAKQREEAHRPVDEHSTKADFNRVLMVFVIIALILVVYFF